MKGTGVLEVIVVAHCEAVGAVKIRRSTEIDVAVFFRIEYSINTGLRRDVYRCRRKTGIFICVVR